MNLYAFDASTATPDQIRAAQGALAALMLYNGKTDGDFGPKSQAAYARFLTPKKDTRFSVLQDEYQNLFDNLRVSQSWQAEAVSIAKSIVANRHILEGPGEKTGVPWWVVGLILQMEAGGMDFRCHLHNGDSLSRRTVNVPAGRPPTGKPPFDWTFSAIDALHFDHFDLWHVWTIPGALYKLEGYNGFGTRRHGVYTPYLWNGSQWWTHGKYVADGQWSETAGSKQVGAAVILKELVALGASLTPPPPPAQES